MKRRLFVLSVGTLSWGLGGCSKEQFSCTDSSGLSPDELEKRASLGYLDKAPKAELQCDNCAQYVAATSEGCGTCRVMPGPTHPAGYCKLFQPKS